MTAGGSQGGVALVLAGGGARGAYEAGALSVLLPALEARGERPRLVLGTSVGALNAAFLAANAQLPADELAVQALDVWESVRWGQVARRLVSTASLLRLGEYVGEVLGVPRARVSSLLDPAPLRDTLRRRVDFRALRRNIAAGALDGAGVVATSALTGRSVVFHDGRPSPPRDLRRGIDYVATPLGAEHVLASAAIPSVFPAVEVSRPAAARGFYVDGGTRLNTPIKPALELGAERVVVVALNSPAPGPPQLAGPERPDALVGAAQILLGLLGDQLTADLQTLATINGLIGPGGPPPGSDKRRVPYILIAPERRDAIGQRALEVIRRHYGGALQALRSPDIALLARLTAGDADVAHAELLSFLLFAPEFAQALVELGEQDARRWLERSHPADGLWELGPPAPPAGSPVGT